MDMPELVDDSNHDALYLSVWEEGGLGYPQSGELSLESDYAGEYKYFGIFGVVDDDSGTYGLSVSPDLCADRFVAFIVQVTDETDVSTDDVLEIEVMTHEIGTVYELLIDEIPDYSHVSQKAHPKDRYTSSP